MLKVRFIYWCSKVVRSCLKWHQCMGQRSNIWQKFQTFGDSSFCKVHMFWTHKLCSQSVRSLYLTVHCACPYAQTPDIQIFLVNLFQKTIIICKSSLIRSNGQNSSSILQFFVTPTLIQFHRYWPINLFYTSISKYSDLLYIDTNFRAISLVAYKPGNQGQTLDDLRTKF